MIADKIYTYEVKVITEFIKSALDTTIKEFREDLFTIKFNVVDPCDSAVIVFPPAGLTFSAMATTVLAGAPVTQDVTSLLPVIEGGFCVVTLRITGYENSLGSRVDWVNVLSYDDADVNNPLLTLETNDENYVDTVTVTIEAFLDPKYGGVAPVSTTFETTITSCVATSLTAVVTNDQTYLLDDPRKAATLVVSAFVLQPACSGGIEYAFTQVVAGVEGPVPSFLT